MATVVSCHRGSVLTMLILTSLASASFRENTTCVNVLRVTRNSTTDTNRSSGGDLETVSSEIVEGTSVCIEIDVSHLLLRNGIHFTNLHSLSLSGMSNSTMITCANDGNHPGIVLRNITNAVSLRNIKLRYCGALFRSNYDTVPYLSALIVTHCLNVDVQNVVVEKSKGIGLMLVDHRGGEVVVRSSVFVENKLPSTYSATDSIQGGGGVFVQVGHLLNATDYSPMVIKFLGCLFENNTASTVCYPLVYSGVLGNVHEGYGSGGGAYVSIENNLANVNISFSRCEFKHNQAYTGGGLSVHVDAKEHPQVISNVTFQVTDSLFRDNGGYNKTIFGGGAFLSLQTPFTYFSNLKNVHYLLRNVIFSNNSAKLGGGAVYYFSAMSKTSSMDLDNSVEFDNCTFQYNIANMGSAINMAPNAVVKSPVGFVTIPVFRDCQFIRNRIETRCQAENVTQTLRTFGIGTIRASQYNIRFEGHNSFENNFGTAIYMVNGNVDFSKGSATFNNNFALRGGAIALIGSSIMIVGPHDYLFVNNIASHQGGAMYVQMIDTNDLSTSRSCFIQCALDHSCDLHANITFTGNKARMGGHAIHTTSIAPCLLTNNNCRDGDLKRYYSIFNTSEELLSCRGVILDHNSTLQPQVTTDGVWITVNSTEKEPIKIIPGEIRKLGMSVRDDFGQYVQSPRLGATIRCRPRGCVNQSDGPSVSQFDLDGVQIKGKPKELATLRVFTISPRQSYITLKIELQECPPGYLYVAKDNECRCNANTYVGLLDCDEKYYQSYLLKGYWAGFIDNTSELVTGLCLHCDYNNIITTSTNSNEVPLPRSNDYSTMDRSICGQIRTGVSCGRCRKSYTVHFHSPDFLCKRADPIECKLGWLFYILSELLPVTLFLTLGACASEGYSSWVCLSVCVSVPAR